MIYTLKYLLITTILIYTINHIIYIQIILIKNNKNKNCFLPYLSRHGSNKYNVVVVRWPSLRDLVTTISIVSLLKNKIAISFQQHNSWFIFITFDFTDRCCFQRSLNNSFINLYVFNTVFNSLIARA